MTSKHHEGWTLWGNARHANWNSVDTGPHRDLLREVGDAVRSQGMKFGFYYSLLEWDRQYTNDTGTATFTEPNYVNNTMIPDLKDLVNTYHPDVLYASRAVQFHPHGGQSDFVWLSARTPHGAYVW